MLNLKKVFTKNAQKSPSNISFILISGIISLIGIFAISNVGIAKSPVETGIQSQIKFELSQSIPVNYVVEKPVIKLSASQYDTQIAVQKQKKRIEVLARSTENRTEGITFEQKRTLAKATAQKYGIDWKILEAVWQVESGKSWDTSKKSYAGATGPMQFMPGTFRAYAEDGDGDGVKSISDANDALASAANMLAKNGLSSGDTDRALFNYNHSMAYVNKVKGVANSIVD